MLFNSFEFAIFFPLVAGIYFCLPQRLRIVHLLLASCVFYMAFIPAYILILALTIVVDYVAGIYIERSSGRKRKLWLISSIVATCAILFIFKYFFFFVDNVIFVTGIFGLNLSSPSLNILLPVGLSFHTFQSLSYVIEVYRGNQKSERNFTIYATYVMFFPQLVAGPIERPQNLLHQFREHHTFDYERIVSGLKRIAWGLFKKVVIADRLALYVNDVYAAPQNYSGLQLTIATVFFAYQIYCDFSGYSDIAVGTARVLGFKLMENFDRPYASRSIAEFWKRWHISLSTWFRDYIYLPLGGNRTSRLRHYLNLLLTFGVSGLWHGANWTYVCWGLLNGVYLVIGHATSAIRQRAWVATSWVIPGFLRPVSAVLTTLMLTFLAWVLFRAKSLSDAWYIYSHLAINWDFTNIGTPQFLLRQMPVAITAIIVLELIQYLNIRKPVTATLREISTPWRWIIYIAFAMILILFGVFKKAQFIYFQF